MADFVKKVSVGFSKCGIDVSCAKKIGVAVSGGADSVSLLLACAEIFGAENVFAVTVNHNIRPEKESGADAAFVADLCRSLGVSCEISVIARGIVAEAAEKRNGGIEEAARFLRYEIFEKFIEKNELDFLCLAHNQNDQLETALMRFLQGSGCDGGGGIASVRGKFVRPLLDISRMQIEEFLVEKKIDWRTDSTNSDTHYLRNRIRNVLIPELDANFDGWRKSVLSGTEKNAADDETLSSLSHGAMKNAICGESINEGKYISIERKVFYSLDKSVRRRVFQSMLSKIRFFGRFPYKLIREIISWNDDEKNHSLAFSSIKISLDSEKLKISFAPGEKIIGSGFYSVRGKFIFRSFQGGDEIRMKDGKMKSVAKIFSEWKVKECDREKITVVQDCASLLNVAVLGRKLGYADWIVDGFFFQNADN